MKFLVNIHSNGIEVVNRFRDFLRSRYQDGDSVIVNFVEPVIKYLENDRWNTFVDLIEENLDKRMSYYGCQYIKKPTELPHRFLNNMFHCGHDLYAKNEMCKNLLAKCTSVENKNTKGKKWDLLLGCYDPDKDMLSEMIKSHKIIDEIFFTYYRKDINHGHWGQSVPMPKKHTAETLVDKTKSMLRYSDLIDPEIYNQTFYTAVKEKHDVDFGAFTEKTAKPIIAQRPFVIFGGHGHLEALKSVGFKTFSPVIDESYDSETDTKTRYRMVIEAMEKLNHLNPVDVYKKLSMVLRYNKAHFEKNNWKTKFKEDTKNHDEVINLNNFD